MRYLEEDPRPTLRRNNSHRDEIMCVRNGPEAQRYDGAGRESLGSHKILLGEKEFNGVLKSRIGKAGQNAKSGHRKCMRIA